MIETIIAWIIGGLAALVLVPIISYLVTKGATLAFFSSKLYYERELEQGKRNKRKEGAHSQ